MPTLFITEYKTAVAPIGTSQAPGVLPTPPVASQAVAIGVGSVASAAFNAATNAVELFTDTACSIAFNNSGATDPTAVATANRMAANERRIYAVQPGAKVAVIN